MSSFVPEPNVAMRRVKVLLVDDLDDNLQLLSALLESPDLDLLQASSGEEALELLLQHEVALALLDVQMPGMDGFELAELMRGSARTRLIPIIFVTAGAREAHGVFRGYDAGAVDFLFKPIEPMILKHKVDTFVSLYRQRSELEQNVERIQKLNRELAETLVLNERFVAAVGHDLRTPLSSVVLGVSQLEATPDRSEQMAILDRIVRSGQRMSRMIDDLFDLARARQSGGIPVTRTPGVDLLEVTQSALRELAARAPASSEGARVTQRGDTRGRWDRARLLQVLSNLLGNAFRHGLATHHVEVDIDGSEPGSVSLSISNGGEIAQELLPVIFEPFRRGASPVRAAEGLGLGLYIVQQVVAAHGGRITVSSGQGLTRFQVVLPRA